MERIDELEKKVSQLSRKFDALEHLILEHMKLEHVDYIPKVLAFEKRQDKRMNEFTMMCQKAPSL